jgi:hypothetical protein
LVSFLVIWSISRSFGTFCGHLVNFIAIWYIFPRFGILYQEKSGNPAENSKKIVFKVRIGCLPTCVRGSPCSVSPGANPTIAEFTATTLALYIAKLECSVENILFYHVHCSVHFPVYFLLPTFFQQLFFQLQLGSDWLHLTPSGSAHLFCINAGVSVCDQLVLN